MKAEIKCSLCKASLATLDDPSVEDAVRLFKQHLPSHSIVELHDYIVKHASCLYPLIEWQYAK